MKMVFILAFLAGALAMCTVLYGIDLIFDAIRRKKDAQLLIDHRIDVLEEKVNKLETKKRGK